MNTATRNAKIQELREHTERAMKEITELETHIASILGSVEDEEPDKANDYWFTASDILLNRLPTILDKDIAFPLSELAPYEEPPYDANDYEWSLSSLDDARHVLDTVKTSVLWWDDRGKRGEPAAEFIEGRIEDAIRDASDLLGDRNFDEAQDAIRCAINDVKVLAESLHFEQWPSAHFSVVVAQSRLEQARECVIRINEAIQDAK